MELVEEGVSNFRDFQTEARDFFSRSDERAKMREKTDKRRSRIHFALLSGLITLVVGLVLWLVSWTVSFEQRHKVVSDQHQTSHSDVSGDPSIAP